MKLLGLVLPCVSLIPKAPLGQPLGWGCVPLCFGGVPLCPGGVSLCPGSVPRCRGGVPLCPGGVSLCPGGVPWCPGVVPRCPGGVPWVPRPCRRRDGREFSALNGSRSFYSTSARFIYPSLTLAHLCLSAGSHRLPSAGRCKSFSAFSLSTAAPAAPSCSSRSRGSAGPGLTEPREAPMPAGFLLGALRIPSSPSLFLFPISP